MISPSDSAKHDKLAQFSCCPGPNLPSTPNLSFGSSTESEREKNSSVLLLFGPEPANDSIPFLKAPREFRSIDCLSSMSAGLESQNLDSGSSFQGTGFRVPI